MNIRAYLIKKSNCNRDSKENICCRGCDLYLITDGHINTGDYYTEINNTRYEIKKAKSSIMQPHSTYRKIVATNNRLYKLELPSLSDEVIDNYDSIRDKEIYVNYIDMYIDKNTGNRIYKYKEEMDGELNMYGIFPVLEKRLEVDIKGNVILNIK